MIKEVSIGVLRYDTKISNGDTNPSFQALKDEVWGSLGYWPFYAKVDDQGNLLEMHEDAPGVIEQENQFASDAGIDYWIFCDFNSAPMEDVVFHNYLISSNKNLVKYCKFLMWEGIRNIHFILDHMTDTHWMTVLDNRPLIYLYGGSIKNPEATITEIRNYTADILGLPNPYIVLFNKQGFGEDCNSEYAPGAWDSNLVGTPYCRLIQSVKKQWTTHASGSKEYIPNAPYNWDPRPWRATPAPWVLNPTTGMPMLPGYWTVPPTGEEYRQMLQSGVNYVLDNAEKCPAMTIISKEWNGQEEGGNICPSLRYGPEACNGIKLVDKSHIVNEPICDEGEKDIIEFHVFNGENSSIDNKFLYEIFSDTNYLFQKGDHLEYDVFLMDCQYGAGGIDVLCNDGSRLQSESFIDGDGVPGYVGKNSLAKFAYKKWHHRNLRVPPAMFGKTVVHWMLAGENDDINRHYVSLYDNIIITDGCSFTRKNVFRTSADIRVCATAFSSDAGVRTCFRDLHEITLS